MTTKNLFYVFLIVASMIGYNAFLAQRDQKMFDAYFGKSFEQSIKK